MILAWAVAHSPLPIEEEDGDDVAVRQVVQRIDEKTGEIFEVPSAKDSLANAKVGVVAALLSSPSDLSFSL